MRVPGVSVFCLTASLVVAELSHPNSSGKWRIDPAKVQEHAI
jgi:hypothetical protein